jgi:Tellurite resistance protein TehB
MWEDHDHYVPWRANFLAWVGTKLGADFINGKTVLEMGCGPALNGDYFQQNGAIVTSTDVRQAYVDTAAATYPALKTQLFNCETDSIPQNFDIILHWATFYHLERNHVQHLNDICAKAKYIILESFVVDSDDISANMVYRFKGYDMSLNGENLIPSRGLIEQTLTANNFNFTVVRDTSLDTPEPVFSRAYSWANGAAPTDGSEPRRLYICWKNGLTSPIKP